MSATVTCRPQHMCRSWTPYPKSSLRVQIGSSSSFASIRATQRSRSSRRSAALGSAVMDTLMEAVVENGTEAEAVGEAVRVLYWGGGALWDAQCTSGAVSHAALHARLPSADPRRRLSAGGDIFHVDLLGGYGGYLFDLARSCVVGGSPRLTPRGLSWRRRLRVWSTSAIRFGRVCVDVIFTRSAESGSCPRRSAGASSRNAPACSFPVSGMGRPHVGGTLDVRRQRHAA